MRRRYLLLKRRRKLKEDGKKKKGGEEKLLRVCWNRYTRAHQQRSLLTQRGERTAVAFCVQIARTKRREAELGRKVRTSTKICTGCVFKTERSFQPCDREIFIDGVKISSVFINELIRIQYAKRNCWKIFIRSSSTFIFTTASIKVNKKIRLCTKQILTTRLVIVKFFPLLRKHPFTLPDNLTICKIASRADPGSDVTRLTFSSAIPVKVFSKFHRLLSIRLIN